MPKCCIIIQEGQQIIYMFHTWMFLYNIFIKVCTKFINVKFTKSFSRPIPSRGHSWVGYVGGGTQEGVAVNETSCMWLKVYRERRMWPDHVHGSDGEETVGDACLYNINGIYKTCGSCPRGILFFLHHSFSISWMYYDWINRKQAF